ncbi:hypothetical protein M3Y95_00835000 [Aphelenchoides besseyi]|nr:hypothetical protein M3Y95_00835000 [Aphelenchoides besseyi]
MKMISFIFIVFCVSVLEAIDHPMVKLNRGDVVFHEQIWITENDIQMSIEQYTHYPLDEPFKQKLKEMGLLSYVEQRIDEFKRTTAETIEKKCAMRPVGRVRRFLPVILPVIATGAISGGALAFSLYQQFKMKNEIDRLKNQIGRLKNEMLSYNDEMDEQIKIQMTRLGFEAAFNQFTERQLVELYGIIEGNLPKDYQMFDKNLSANLLDVKMTNVSCRDGTIYATIEETFAQRKNRHQLYEIQAIGTFDAKKEFIFTPELPSLAYLSGDDVLSGLNSAKCKALSSTAMVCSNDAKNVDCDLSTFHNCTIVVEPVHSPFVRIHHDRKQFHVMTDLKEVELDGNLIRVPTSGIMNVTLLAKDVLKVGTTVLTGTGTLPSVVKSVNSPDLFRLTTSFNDTKKRFVAKMRADRLLDLVEEETESTVKTPLTIVKIAALILVGLAILHDEG